MNIKEFEECKKEMIKKIKKRSKTDTQTPQKNDVSFDCVFI